MTDQPAAPLPPPGQDPRRHKPQPAAPPSTPVPAAPTAAVPARRPRRNRQELTARERAVTASDELSFATMETELGGRKQLVAVLAAADINGDENSILALLADPQNDGISLAKLCLGGGLSLSRLMTLFKAAALAKGQVKAIARIAAKLPDVAAGVMEDAIGGEKICKQCNGYQFLPAPTEKDPNATEKCPKCLGKGMVLFEPDSDVREMALRIGGLLEKGGGSKIAILQSFGQGSAANPGSFDTLMSGLDRELYGDGRARQRQAPAGQPPIDGETV